MLTQLKVRETLILKYVNYVMLLQLVEKKSLHSRNHASGGTVLSDADPHTQTDTYAQIHSCFFAPFARDGDDSAITEVLRDAAAYSFRI
jgi:hypothetical protein